MGWDGLTQNKPLSRKSGRWFLDLFLVPVSLAMQLQSSFCPISYITGTFSISNPWVIKWYKFLGTVEGNGLSSAAVIAVSQVSIQASTIAPGLTPLSDRRTEFLFLFFFLFFFCSSTFQQCCVVHFHSCATDVPHLLLWREIRTWLSSVLVSKSKGSEIKVSCPQVNITQYCHQVTEAKPASYSPKSSAHLLRMNIIITKKKPVQDPGSLCWLCHTAASDKVNLGWP